MNMMNLSSQSATTSRSASVHAYGSSVWRVIIWIAGVLSLIAGLYLLILWPWISHWGATNEEVLQPLPGDDLIENASLVTTKAITIEASPEEIWPWLLQLGVDRGGMYSYLWVENWLLRLNVENSDVVRPEWQHLQVGDFIRFTPKKYTLNPGPGLYVLAMETNYALAGCFGMEGLAVDCNKSATWQFVLVPQANRATRLILRSRNAGPPSLLASFTGKLGSAFQFYMERKMLLGLKERAEMAYLSGALPIDGLE